MGASDENAIFEKGPVVIFRWRNAAGWPVEHVSSNVLDVLGYSADEFRSGAVSYADLIDSADIERVAGEVQSASALGLRSFAHEPYRIRRRDGGARWLYDYTHIVRSVEGDVTHFVGYVFDITSRMLAEAEKQELERRLLHAQKLESLGVLAGGVAHDFNNLLTGILGQVGLLRRALDQREPDCDRMRRGLDQIESIGQRAADLTRQLLAYSGKGRTIVEPVNLAALVDEMASILDVARSKKATLVRRFDAPLPLVLADRTQLQQVVMNLLTNASEALGEKPGTITIRIGHGRYSSDQLAALFGDRWALEPGAYVTFEIEDDGCGMSAEAQERLFDPFFTTKFAGRGLGMSAVLGIVRAHHAAIRVRSTEGEGSSFLLAFPATLDAVERKIDKPSDHRIDADGTVLVADDEPFVRKTLAMLLSSLGFAVIEAENGAEAVERFRAHRERIVLAIIDMTMPVLSGADALRAIRAIDNDVPVALSSGYSDAAVREADVQPTVFLQKPYTLEELERVLRTVIPPSAVTRSP
jgi:PAS domain S-box-containing protein